MAVNFSDSQIEELRFVTLWFDTVVQCSLGTHLTFSLRSREFDIYLSSSMSL